MNLQVFRIPWSSLDHIKPRTTTFWRPSIWTTPTLCCCCLTTTGMYPTCELAGFVATLKNLQLLHPRARGPGARTYWADQAFISYWQGCKHRLLQPYTSSALTFANCTEVQVLTTANCCVQLRVYSGVQHTGRV